MKSQDKEGCFSLCPSLRELQGTKQFIPLPQPLSTRRGEVACFASLAMTRRFKILLLLPFTLYLLPLPCLSQDPPISLTYEAASFGYGTSEVYDSYLSPLRYTGNNVGLNYEKMKNTGLMNGNVAAQHLFNVNYSWTKNNPGTASYYSGFIEYDYGLLYQLKPVEKLQVFAGMQAGAMLGFVYNTRNGNNPATGKAHLDLSLSAIANYRMNIFSQPIYLRNQISLPLIGILYSPEFGESYYEIGLGDTDGLVHFASFHNYFSVRNMLSAEIPLNRFTLRFSYLFSFYETRINDLDTRLISNTFYIGFSTNFFVVKGKQKNNNYRYVFE